MPTRRGCMFALVLALMLLPATMLTTAQEPIQQPYILSFEHDLSTPLTLPATELGQTETTLQWAVRGVNPQVHTLQLQRFAVNQWQPLRENAPATGSETLLVQHPGNFGPPTYRLTIVDPLSSAVLDERVLTLPYADQPAAPIIARFVADGSAITRAGLADRSQQLPVTWQIDNRQPYSNLAFWQVLPDGTLRSVELPRDFAWVPSTGVGAVAPLPVDGGDTLTLRLQVTDVRDDRVLATQDLPVQLGAPSTAAPVILNFAAAPTTIARQGTITVAWSVAGAELVQVGQIAPDGRYLRDGEMPLNGSMAFTALDNAYYTQDFFIYAGDADGNGVTETLSVAVTCPYTFFFATDLIDPAACPRDEVQVFPAAYQLFDRGEMLWRADRGEIVVVLADGTYMVYEDTYQEGETIDYPAAAQEATVGDENTLPIRGFGKVWAQNPDVANGLGFAIGEEIGYEMRGQAVAYGRLARGYAEDYLTFPDGSVIELALDGTWRKVAE